MYNATKIVFPTKCSGYSFLNNVIMYQVINVYMYLIIQQFSINIYVEKYKKNFPHQSTTSNIFFDKRMILVRVIFQQLNARHMDNPIVMFNLTNLSDVLF